MAHPPGDWPIREWEEPRDFCDRGLRYCPYRTEHRGDCSPEECSDREADEESQEQPESIDIDDLPPPYGRAVPQLSVVGGE